INSGALYGGVTVVEAAEIFINVLSGNGTKEQADVVIANAALAIRCYFENKPFTEALDMARESLRSGKALNSFKILQSLN
ncbi:MAG TPA: anthranilate phosphoribosyltransferase, partial [Bacteroidia bacterium]